MIFDAAALPTLWPYGAIACGFYFSLTCSQGAQSRPE